MEQNRREFIKKSGCALSMAALASQVEHFGLMSALAQKSDEATDSIVPSDYRALICIFMSGGNDGNNTVIPNHNDANVSNYAAYSAARAPQGLALAQNTLLPIAVPRIGNLSYGLHPSFGSITGGINSGIHELWLQQKLAMVTNVGTLVEPLTRTTYQNGSGRRPFQLFSHSDQVNQHQTARSDTPVLNGWGGRISDKLTLSANPNRLVPTLSTIAGTTLFTIGQTTQPAAFAPAPTPLSNVLALLGNDNTPISNARMNALNGSLNLSENSELIGAANLVSRQAIEISQALGNNVEVTVAFPNTTIGNQLKQVGRIIKSRQVLNVTRQVFFCTLGGFDTHTGQLTNQANLLGQLSQAMRSLYEEMIIQGLSDKVTQFTLSDFCRTFNPGGTGANVGSDHAWANHSFMLGGSVIGGDFYGMNTSNGTPFPSLVRNGPDDADSTSTARGRWIPSTSVEQYAATLAAWFGLDATDRNYVFPNLQNFQTQNLGFMMP